MASSRGRIGVGVIGLGTISALHMEGLFESEERARVVAVCDMNLKVAKAQAARFSARAYSDYKELLADDEVEMVDILLPHNLHFAVAMDAISAGKHVLVEKPMAPTVAECEELVEAARRQGLTLTVAENTRFVTAYQAVERVLESGEIGSVRSVRTFVFGSEVERLSDPSLWKGRKDGTVGGAIMDAGAHSFYLLGWLIGDIAEVRAQGAKLVEASEVEDNALVTGRIAGDVLFSSEFTFTAELPWGERLEVYGSKGSVIVDQLAHHPVTVYKGEYDFEGRPLFDVERDVAWWKGRSVATGVKDFVDALFEGRAPLVDPMDGVKAIGVVEAAYRSMAMDGARVAVRPLAGDADGAPG
jgi:predicted dehydrogenase